MTAKKPATVDALLVQGEVAARLRVSTGTLQNWRYKKIGPDYVKVGRGVRYFESAINDYLAEQKREAA